MPHYLILAQSEVTANALGAWLELLGENGQAKGRKGDGLSPIVWDRPAGKQSAVDAYETLVQSIEDAARAGDKRVPLNQVVALVDWIRPIDLNAAEVTGSWNNLIAMLILTFPEIRWVFGVCGGTEKQERWKESVEQYHNLRSLLTPGYRRDPVFDPTGLREWVRARTCDGLSTADDDFRLASRREKIAAAIDEERPYAYFHGYTAYRFGYRADAVMTWALMKERFDAKNRPHIYSLLLEDMSLMFPDRPNHVRLHDLNTERAKECRQLDSTNAKIEKSDYRILVTTGQARSGDTTLWANRTYLHNKVHGRGDVVFKPACGMFDLWTKVGLFRKWAGTRRRGDVPGFVCPPDDPSATHKSELDSAPNNTTGPGHGTPGKLMLVSEALVRRASALLGKVECVDEAVQGAVLATDALELTGGRAPTMAIEALSLKHSFEVLAECQFSGVAYHLSIAPRLAEIDLETHLICQWRASRKRESAALNARMHILTQMIGILRQHNQFDEEQICMNRVRHLHATLWMREHPWRYLFWIPIRYVELLLSSFRGFVAIVAVWIMILGLLFASAEPNTSNWGVERLVKGLESAVTSFFSVGPPMQHGASSAQMTQWQVFVSSVAMMSGFLHLGVLISHLYMIVSRR